jgi:hypothetical protein
MQELALTKKLTNKKTLVSEKRSSLFVQIHKKLETLAFVNIFKLFLFVIK